VIVQRLGWDRKGVSCRYCSCTSPGVVCIYGGRDRFGSCRTILSQIQPICLDTYGARHRHNVNRWSTNLAGSVPSDYTRIRIEGPQFIFQDTDITYRPYCSPHRARGYPDLDFASDYHFLGSYFDGHLSPPRSVESLKYSPLRFHFLRFQEQEFHLVDYVPP